MKYPLEDECPCGSGKSYRECCDGKAFTWLVDSEGFIFRQMYLNPELSAMISKLHDDYKERFGVSPAPTDSIFPELLHSSKEEYIAHGCEFLSLMGAPESHIYAFMQTELVVLPGGENRLTGNDYSMWLKAKTEYEINQKKQPHRKRNRSIVKVLASEIAILSDVLSTTASKTIRVGVSDVNLLEFIGHCATRSLGLTKSITILEDEFRSHDALLLVRGILENYLTIGWCISQPAAATLWLEANQNLDDIRYQYVRKPTGELNYQKIRCIATGAIIDSGLKFSRMARNGPFPIEDSSLFDFLYVYLSSFVHPDPESFSEQLVGRKFSIGSNARAREAVIYTAILLAMTLDLLSGVYTLPKRRLAGIAKVFSGIQEIFEAVCGQENEEASEISPFLSRIRRLGEFPTKQKT